VTLATAGLLACGSMLAPGLPSFPVASGGRLLAAYSCGGSRGFGSASALGRYQPDPVPFCVPEGNRRWREPRPKAGLWAMALWAQWLLRLASRVAWV